MTDMFEYTTKAGEVIRLPRLDDLPFGVGRKLRHADSVGESVFMLVELTADEETLAVVDTLHKAEIEALFEAWQQTADDEEILGKSEASSTG